MSDQEPLYLGIDIGTGSVRAATFKSSGEKVSYHSEEIETRQPSPNHYEQSTTNIWRATISCVREVCIMSKLRLKDSNQYIASIGVDATCSLAVCYDDGLLTPVQITDLEHKSEDSYGSADVFNIMLWLDSRSVEDAMFINNLGRENDQVKAVLQRFGGKISPENQPPKIRWLCRKNPRKFRQGNILFFDLADWLVAKLTSCADINARSTCTLSCKWGWNDHKWNSYFWTALNLEHLSNREYRSIGTAKCALYPGRRVAKLSHSVAQQFGIDQQQECVVAAPLIDAYAGSVWTLGIDSSKGFGGSSKFRRSNDEIEQIDGGIVSFVCGTSTCLLQLSQDQVFVPGVWGPFKGSLIPDYYVTEGGQSVTGKLLQHIVHTHPDYPNLREKFGDDDNKIFEYLARFFGNKLYQDDDPLKDPATHVHYLDHHAGNRSPLADPTLRGIRTGISLEENTHDLAVQFRAVLQSICYGGKSIIEAFKNSGLTQTSLIAACGGMCKSRLFLTELADCLQVPIALCSEPDTVLLGCSIIARMAHEKNPDMANVARKMTSVGDVIYPNIKRKQYHMRKYMVYKRLQTDYIEYRNIMIGESLYP